MYTNTMSKCGTYDCINDYMTMYLKRSHCINNNPINDI